jgi:ArsR family transcriptional regulator, virulence genes transcriptional regulator
LIDVNKSKLELSKLLIDEDARHDCSMKVPAKRCRPAAKGARVPVAAAMQARAGEAALLLKALANPQRLRVLCELAGGELSVGELNRCVDLSQSALSQHLSRLREEGLVATRREAQTIYYRLVPGTAQQVIDVLHARFCTPAAPPDPASACGRQRLSGRARSAPSRGK